MIWRDTIDLVAVSQTQDEYGAPVESETTIQVFANKKSIRQSEFYQALTTGLELEIMFEIRSIEYGGESRIRFENELYYIIRTHSKNEEILELICSKYPTG